MNHVTPAEFLEANAVRTWLDLGPIVRRHRTLGGIATEMTQHWTFDGALFCDHAALVVALADLKADHVRRFTEPRADSPSNQPTQKGEPSS